MKISMEKKKAEAIRRMELLGIFPETIKQFEKYGIVSFSQQPFGAYYWVSDDDKKLIKNFEEKYNALVYTVVRTYFRELGKLDSYFYVSDEETEWAYDRELFKNNEAFVYVQNHDDPWCSEFGSIGIKLSIAAGLLRTW